MHTELSTKLKEWKDYGVVIIQLIKEFFLYDCGYEILKILFVCLSY